MDKDYTINDVRRGEEWSFNGQPMQDYAIAIQGEEGWIKLTQKPETRPPRKDENLHGHIETKKMPNGTPYRKFKKVTPEFGGGRSSQPVVGQDDSKLVYITQMLEELTGRREPGDVASQRQEAGPSNPDDLEDPFNGLV